MLNKQTKTVDRQAAFDLMVSKLMEQGHRATPPDQNRCEYLSEDGSRCAVGWLIDDDLISHNLTGTAGRALNSLGILLLYGDMHFLRHAQIHLHDSLTHGIVGDEFRTELLNAAEEFASNFGLKFDRGKFSG